MIDHLGLSLCKGLEGLRGRHRVVSIEGVILVDKTCVIQHV